MLNLPGMRPKNDLHQIRQIKQWVSEEFGLEEEVPVLVTELQCTEEGCPPLETVIAIMDRPGQPRQHKLHKALADVTIEDIVELAHA
ncbi:MAG: hypothetical protein HC875_41795 [Anaerolineales bacterium]|nr:hypothetical protein [Anaerolineales bacterium]